ncbi:hypothetical protein WKI68_43985 [Streptomyces sp. MS1.HAVA.3]|uniref:Uncharacterized protein n=1 Tax=Streptomyces caledonius TaxID=3134107 RepID=A0ABU8UEM2_9ACTN
MRERPVAAPGVVLDVDAARDDGTWTYSEYDTPGIRLTIPRDAAARPGALLDRHRVTGRAPPCRRCAEPCPREASGRRGAGTQHG